MDRRIAKTISLYEQATRAHEMLQERYHTANEEYHVTKRYLNAKKKLYQALKLGVPRIRQRDRIIMEGF